MESGRCGIRTALLVAVLATTSGPVRAAGETLHVPPTAECAAEERPEVLVYGAWGSRAGQFGKVDEAARPGPMDFVVRAGTLYVLDAVNGRVQLFDLRGGFQGEIAVGTQTASFLCVDDGGEVTVLDAFVRREFKTFSPRGELLAQAGIPESIGLCSAIWAEGERLWIEERHDRVHEIRATRDAHRTSTAVVGALTGRPVGPAGSPVQARKAGRHDVIVQARTPTTLRFDRPVAAIVALESDDRGRIYLGAACLCGESGDEWTTDIVLVAVDPAGRIAGTVRMPNAYITDHYRKLCVSRAGEVIQMQTVADGVRFVRWTLRAPAEGGWSR
jgi:hypothetical protein